MKKIYTVLLATLLVITSVQAQITSPEWKWAISDTSAVISINPAYPHSVAAAHNGHILWGASQNAQVSWSAYSLGDYKFTRFDSTGTEITSTDMTGQMNFIDARTDNAGNWYLLGVYRDSIQFANGFTAVNQNMAMGNQPFICKLHSDALSLQWFEPIGSTETSTDAFYIQDTSIYFAVAYFDSVVVSRMNTTTGSTTALFTQVGARDISSIVVDADNNIYIAGSCDFRGTIDFNGHTTTVPFTYQTFIVRYRSNGQFDWVQWMSDVTCTGRQLNIADNNILYYTGVVNDTMSLDGHSFHNPQWGTNYIAAQLDSNGHVNWAKQMKDTVAGDAVMMPYSATVGADNSLILAPNTRGYIDWGNGVASNLPLSSYSASIVNISANGNAQWEQSIISNYLGLQHIVADGNGVLITGNTGFDTSGNIQLGNISMPVRRQGYAPYIAKLRIPGTAGIPPVCKQAEIYVVPNPTTNAVAIKNLNAINEDLTIRMLDVAGRVVYNKDVTGSKGDETVNVSTYPRGLYFIQVTGKSFRQVTKLILQ